VCFPEEIGDDEIGSLVGIEVSGRDAHAAFCPALSTHSQPGDKAAILPGGGVRVPCEQSVGCGIVGDEDFGRIAWFSGAECMTRTPSPFPARLDSGRSVE
jgi:hypothetical protein